MHWGQGWGTGGQGWGTGLFGQLDLGLKAWTSPGLAGTQEQRAQRELVGWRRAGRSASGLRGIASV